MVSKGIVALFHDQLLIQNVLSLLHTEANKRIHLQGVVCRLCIDTLFVKNVLERSAKIYRIISFET